MTTFFQKLAGRDVTRVAAAYLAVAWLLVEVLITISEPLGIPDWVGKVTIVSALIGFPIALIIAWMFKLTPEGRLERESATDVSLPSRIGGRKIDFVIIGALALAIVFLLVDRRLGTGVSDRAGGDDRPFVTSVKKLSDSSIYLPPFSSVFPLVVDDSRVYFDHDEDGMNKIGQISRTGGQVLTFERPFDNPNIGTALERLSFDKTALVLNVWNLSESMNVDDVEIWEVPLVGGSPRKIGNGYQSDISPDGTKMIFRRGWTDLYLANADMSGEEKIFSANAASLYWLRFSPDGTRVRFTVFTDHFAGSIWEYSLESGESYPILPNWEAKYSCCGSWTPDGKYFVFESSHEAGPQIWAIRSFSDGSLDPAGPFRLTSEAMDFKRPTISEDGKTIYVIGWQLRGEIVEKAPSDQEFHPIIGLNSMSVEQVDYSINGEWAAFVSYPEGHLWQKELARDKATQLTFGTMRVANPRVSPDGEMIAFEGWEPGEHKKILLVPRDGGDIALISDEEVRSWAPSWSPDGTKLMFSEDAETSPLIYDLLVNTVRSYGGADPIYGATWAPDGSKVLGWSKKNLVVYDFGTGKHRIIVQNTPPYTRYWAADSKHVYLVDSWIKGVERSVYRLRIDDKTIEKVLQVGGERITWGTSALWVGVTPEGAVMYLRDHSIHNIYALEWNAD